MNLIPEGTWTAHGVTAALGFTRDNNEQVGVELVFAPDQDADVDGRRLTWYGSFSEKAERFTLKTLRTLGWSSDDLSDLSGVDANPVEVVVVHEEDRQGEWRARIRFINPIGSGGVAMKTKMSEEQARAFAERMRGKVLALGKPAPAAAAAAAKPAKPKPTPKRAATAAADAPDDDDVPF